LAATPGRSFSLKDSHFEGLEGVPRQKKTPTQPACPEPFRSQPTFGDAILAPGLALRDRFQGRKAAFSRLGGESGRTLGLRFRDSRSLAERAALQAEVNWLKMSRRFTNKGVRLTSRREDSTHSEPEHMRPVRVFGSMIHTVSTPIAR
jgi:hypothetical protein